MFIDYHLKLCFFQDDKIPLSPHSHQELIQYAIKNNCTRQIYDFLIESSPNFVNIHFNNLFIYSKCSFFFSDSTCL